MVGQTLFQKGRCRWSGFQEVFNCKLLFGRRLHSEMSFLVLLVTLFIPFAKARLQYTLESCGDFVPRDVPLRENYEYYQPLPNWHNRETREVPGSLSPFTVTVPGGRYRRNSDLYVQIEGNGYLTGLMVQGRGVNTHGNVIPTGVSLIGRFESRHLPHGFKYLGCFYQSQATVIYEGNLPYAGNISLVWTTPDADVGNIRFTAGVTQGAYYWITHSNILTYNPFPLSTSLCGTTEACYRVCPLDTYDGSCYSHNSQILYTYSTDVYGKRAVEFTLGGQLWAMNNSYVAVVYAEDSENLYQADVTACYVENGRVQIAHLQMDVVGAPLTPHSEEVFLLDSDIDRNMVWCRYSRPTRRRGFINHEKNFYTLLYRGELDLHHFPRFYSPSRSSMYGGEIKTNLTAPVNVIISGSSNLHVFGPSQYFVVFSLVGLSVLAMSFN